MGLIYKRKTLLGWFWNLRDCEAIGLSWSESKFDLDANHFLTLTGISGMFWIEFKVKVYANILPLFSVHFCPTDWDDRTFSLVIVSFSCLAVLFNIFLDRCCCSLFHDLFNVLVRLPGKGVALASEKNTTLLILGIEVYIQYVPEFTVNSKIQIQFKLN